MGNFLEPSQRYESLRNRDTEDGIMVHVLVSKDHEQNQNNRDRTCMLCQPGYTATAGRGRMAVSFMKFCPRPMWLPIRTTSEFRMMALLERIGASLGDPYPVKTIFSLTGTALRAGGRCRLQSDPVPGGRALFCMLVGANPRVRFQVTRSGRNRWG